MRPNDRARATFFLIMLLAGCAGAPEGERRHAGVVAVQSGSWFTGSGFEPRTMYMREGRFVTAPNAAPDSIIDLAGSFVVPPFAEGHNHWLEPAALQAYVQSYLRDGVFYLKDQGNSPYVRTRIDTALNSPNSVDVVSANQGWTGPGGHPLQIARQFVAFGVFPSTWVDSLDPNVVLVVSDSADIAARWPRFLESKPAFVKVFLLHSEEHGSRRGNPAFDYRRGIDPALLPEIVRRAHAAGLRVSAHIYTAGDFRLAIRGGVDDIAHFPGTGLGTEPDLPAQVYRITDADAREAARRRVTVTTTLSWLDEVSDPVQRARMLADVIRPNLALLREHGVRLLVGSDQFRQTPATEADLLVRTGLFTPLQALVAWSMDTPRSLFPSRNIGQFSPGAEASFLALNGNPLADFRNVHRITLRVKQGRPLRLQDPAPAFPPPP
jgi:cytosine/adenosine deaminase-related metal-dependent hydrolase